MRKIIDYIVLYIIGNIIFNLIFSLAELFISFILSVQLNFCIILIKNFVSNFWVYTIFYIITILIIYFIDLSLINELNKKLKGGAKNEE